MMTPDEPLQMDWDTAIWRTRALFMAIEALANEGDVESAQAIGWLAELGRDIIQDQLHYQEQEDLKEAREGRKRKAVAEQ
jgi:hypothetical protein